MPVAAAISALGTIGALAIKNKMDKKRYERELQDQQKAWQRTNQYNSPAAQMARLKAAGLSPNLIYQNGGATATSDTQGVPSYPDAPIADFNSSAQMLQQSPTLAANIRKINAETETIASENKDRFSPLSKLYNLNEDEKRYYASEYGITPELMDEFNINRIHLLADLKKVSSENENVRKIYDLISNQVNQSESEAMTAKLIQLLTELEVSTEAKKRGYSLSSAHELVVNPRHFGTSWNPNRWYALLKEHNNDYVFDMFYRQLKELHWQSSDGKHILDQVHQFMHDIPAIGSLRRGKPTIRGIERYGYDSKRGDWNTYERYDYGK